MHFSGIKSSPLILLLLKHKLLSSHGGFLTVAMESIVSWKWERAFEHVKMTTSLYPRTLARV